MAQPHISSILLVDDEQANLDALEAVLEGLGQRLIRALRGEQALKCVLEHDFAVILLDVQMPGMSGIETAALIRARERSRTTPIIFLTGMMRTAEMVFSGYSAGLRAAQLPGGSPVRRNEVKMAGSEKFLAMFGKPARLLACECERSSETTLGQTFQLISSPEINALLTNKDNRLTTLLASGKPNADVVGDLYWTALSRPPSAREISEAVKVIESLPDRRTGLEDVAWALLNAKEFVLRR